MHDNIAKKAGLTFDDMSPADCQPIEVSHLHRDFFYAIHSVAQ